SSSTPSTDGKEVDGDTWFRIVGNDIVGQWNWFEGLGWLTKTVGHQVISAIDAGKITVGALDGGVIKAGTVSADRLVVGGISNKIVDPFFQNSDINAVRCTTWQHNGLVEADPTNQRLVVKPGFSGWVSSTINPISFATTPYNASGGTPAARQPQLSNYLPVQPGDVFILSMRIQNASTVASDAVLGFLRRNKQGQWLEEYMAEENTGGLGPGQTVNATLTYTVPSGTYYILPYVGAFNDASATGNVYISDVTLYQQTTGVQIANGAITASKLAVGAVTADRIAAGAIDGKVITGATICTAASGMRVEMSGTL